jgi:hypothetical protein
MGARQSILNLDPGASACSRQHTLFYGLAVVAIAALVAGPVGLQAQRDIRIPVPSYHMPPDFPAAVNAVIPTPQYLPAGYELWTIKRPLADGFGTGKAEIEIQYRDPGCWDRKMNCSLQLFVSPVTDRPLSGTAGRTPEKLSLRIGSRTVDGQYFNRIEPGSTPGVGTLPDWQGARLETANFNALVFAFDRFMVAICGNRTTGVGRSELLKVAESLTYTAR